MSSRMRIISFCMNFLCIEYLKFIFFLYSSIATLHILNYQVISLSYFVFQYKIKSNVFCACPYYKICSEWIYLNFLYVATRLGVDKLYIEINEDLNPGKRIIELSFLLPMSTPMSIYI